MIFNAGNPVICFSMCAGDQGWRVYHPHHEACTNQWGLWATSQWKVLALCSDDVRLESYSRWIVSLLELLAWCKSSGRSLWHILGGFHLCEPLIHAHWSWVSSLYRFCLTITKDFCKSVEYRSYFWKSPQWWEHCMLNLTALECVMRFALDCYFNRDFYFFADFLHIFDALLYGLLSQSAYQLLRWFKIQVAGH